MPRSAAGPVPPSASCRPALPRLLRARAPLARAEWCSVKKMGKEMKEALPAVPLELGAELGGFQGAPRTSTHWMGLGLIKPFLWNWW